MYENLITRAGEQIPLAYAPYSGFCVGAALLAKDSQVYTGVNVENASYGATICAERVAVLKAVSEGVREFTAIAVTSSGDDYCYPCGVCLQVLAEFCDADTFDVIAVKNNSDYKVHKLSELLPFGFKI